MNKTTKTYCTSAEASKLLGISTTSIQKLVEKKVLECWKTQGGHRRISIKSIENYLGKSITSDESLDRSIFLVSDDSVMIEKFKSLVGIGRWNFKSISFRSKFEAFSQCMRFDPEIIIFDTACGEESLTIDFLSSLGKIDHFSDRVFVLIGDDDKFFEGLLGYEVYIKKYFCMEWFEGFLSGVLQRRGVEHVK